jgi:NAD(P)-dependent dehydrogenase (short-subunit alcohol dehydrogenase family)
LELATKVWFISGTSTGLGRALAQAVLHSGQRLVATSRDVARIQDLQTQAPDRALVLPLDVTDPAQVRQAASTALEHFGQIDVLVNNAGTGLLGALEELTVDQIHRNLQVNFLGPLRLVREVLPSMRQRRSGHIVNIGAIAASVAEPGFTAYGASKAALESASEALLNEVRLMGIKVTIVIPGPFRTPFIGQIERAESTLEDYARTSGKFAQFLTKFDGSQPGDPARAAQAILKAVASERPPVRLVLGKFANEKLRSKFRSVEAEMDAWSETAIPVDFAQEPAAR